MHLVTKRSPILAGSILLLMLVSTAMYFHLRPLQSTTVHAAPVTVSANGTTYTCVPQPTITPPPTPKGAHSSGEQHAALCPAGQVPQPNRNTSPRDQGAVPGTPEYAAVAQKPMTLCTLNGSAYYCYVTLNEPVSDVGVDSSMSQPNPFVKSTDYHSFAEIMALNDTRDRVGLGNGVASAVFGDTHTHLFIESFVGGTWKGYDGGNGYVQYSSTLTPGMQVTASSINTYFYEIEYSGGNWWIYYDSGWVGYYPGSSWTSFTSTTQGAWYGEVAASTTSPCSDMGNGNFGSNTTATRPQIVAGTDTGTYTFASTPTDTNSSWYDNSIASSGGTTEQFYYGGPGSGGIVKGC